MYKGVLRRLENLKMKAVMEHENVAKKSAQIRHLMISHEVFLILPPNQYLSSNVNKLR